MSHQKQASIDLRRLKFASLRNLWGKLNFKALCWSLSLIMVLGTTFVSFAEAKEATKYTLFDAKLKGVFNIGQAKGNIIRTADKELAQDVYSFNYEIPKTTIIGVWTKNYPAELSANSADLITIGVKLAAVNQEKQIAVTVEIKGSKGIQKIKFDSTPGWNFIDKEIAWSTIGALDEVVFVVESKMGEATAKGNISLALNFGKFKFLQTTIGKVAAILLISLLCALLGFVFNKLLIKANKEIVKTSDSSLFARFKKDIIYGIAAVLIIYCAIDIYSIGTMSAIKAGFCFLWIGLLGAVIAELLKWRMTGKHLTAGEIFQNVLFIGLLAATSTTQELLAPPSSWSQILLSSNLIATIAFLIYQISNASALASGKHLKAVNGALIVGTPYLFGWLLLLENVNLLVILSNSLTGGILSAWPQIVEAFGRFIVVLAFNEIILNAIGLSTKGRLLKGFKAHLCTVFVSLSVVLSPWIADFGSSAWVASLPLVIRSIIAIITAMFSQAGLWGEVYLLTGVILDGTHSFEPSRESIGRHVSTGMKKGMAYSGIVMALIYGLHLFLTAPGAETLMTNFPIIMGMIGLALIFPLLKTIIETFDGSMAFFARVRYNYKNLTLYSRGAVAGFGLSYAIGNGLFEAKMGDRVTFGLIVGLVGSVGISFLRDAIYGIKNQGKIQTWKLYLVDAVIGTFVGSAAAFYLDAAQVPVVITKFNDYLSAGLTAHDFTIYPLLNKWGRVDLGAVAGGVKLFYNEAFSGVINWAVAAWLFAINRAFMEAFFQKDKTPIKFLFSKKGLVELIKHMIQVLRWGLWMAPIINTFLRMMPEPTWYNQDGAIRTIFCIFNNATMSSGEFQAWSLKMFIYLLAYDFVRIIIWIDHMGLRVATLVNLSFIGMNKLDEKVSKFIGTASSQRYIPEAVKRFTTWGPLLIPFYIPRGENWDYAWAKSQEMMNASGANGLLTTLRGLGTIQLILLVVASIMVCTLLSFIIRSLGDRFAKKRKKVLELSNREYKIVLNEDGGGYSQITKNSYDISRRSYDTIDPSGRVLFVVDTAESPESAKRSWPVFGNFPKDRFNSSSFEKADDTFKIINETNDIKTTVEISLPDMDAPAEIWTVKVENKTANARKMKLVPYLEWVLDLSDKDRGHTQYARLFPKMGYESSANAILTWQQNTKYMGILASAAPAEGFLTSRMDFIGRAQSIWAPRALQTLNFAEPCDTESYPTFDPIGSLVVNIDVAANSEATMKFLVGCTKSKETALELINIYLKPEGKKLAAAKQQKTPLIGHGEILPGTPQPYYEYTNKGNTLKVLTPYTPRPYDHAMSNIGHSVMVTNRGLHTSCNGNSQQNRLTPDWADTVTKEVPAEAIYLYDPESNEWFSPTHHPLNDNSAKNSCEFSVDGSAVFYMEKGSISTELTVFVPTEEPTGVYLLTVKNTGNKSRKIRVAPYFQIVLSGQPEWAGPLLVNKDKKLNALYYENPRNIFRQGIAFASMSINADCMETKRGKFFGSNRGLTFPYMVEHSKVDETQLSDDRSIASFVGTLDIPAGGEVSVAIVLGQADTKKEAVSLIKKYKDIENVKLSLADTRKWWLSFAGTLNIETTDQEFDNLQNWLKYQGLAERIWARRGFYQTSGAYGFRDQLQDTVNLIWVDPKLARKQILLHASQQFIEGDVFHWFFTLPDGRSSFSNRSHASDNLLWLAWGVADYIKLTGDETILDEMTSYMEALNPFQPLPHNKHGWGDIYNRSTRADTVYRHCLRSIDLVLEKRTGVNGLPLIGTGDWNDGLDEIGSEGKGESIWLGFFLSYILKNLMQIIEKKDGVERKNYYQNKLDELQVAIEKTWRNDRYLRAFHDDGTEIGVEGSGIWETDALTAAWSIIAGINPEREEIVFNTALRVLDRDNVILLGWPALREDSKPFLGRSSHYPEGVRENGMYCHGDQWLIKAARLLAERFDKEGNKEKSAKYKEIAYKLWLKITPVYHMKPEEIEIYGGQPNKQAADMLTTYDQGRMIWNGYTGASGWLLREAMEGVIGARIRNNSLVLPADLADSRGGLKVKKVERDLSQSPIK